MCNKMNWTECSKEASALYKQAFVSYFYNVYSDVFTLFFDNWLYRSLFDHFLNIQLDF